MRRILLDWWDADDFPIGLCFAASVVAALIHEYVAFAILFAGAVIASMLWKGLSRRV